MLSLLLVDMILKLAFGPRMSRNAGSKIWKKGGAVDVGLNSWLKEELRKGPLGPRTANDLGSTSYFNLRNEFW